jgi:D-cysteine desulfhydrase family pyridoxal phosphate-dependent enzyme
MGSRLTRPLLLLAQPLLLPVRALATRVGAIRASAPPPLLSKVAYSPPTWASHLLPPTHGRILLGRLETPVVPWKCGALADLGVTWSIKRDDTSGLELSGNKVRKLEFLMAEALAGGHDCVVTIGGIQSNHCRATAAAAALLGVDAHLILRCPAKDVDGDLGLCGNLLLDRLLGATLHTCTVGEYQRVGSPGLTAALAEQLRAQGKKPYVIPVGGSNALGTWGYIEAVRELEAQLADRAAAGLPEVTHIVFACGSGGTAAGLALGAHLSGLKAKVHGVGVCDTPDIFYADIAAMAAELGACAKDDPDAARGWLSLAQGKNTGYAQSTPEELAFIRDLCFESGVLTDPVYSGKALYHFVEGAKAAPEEFRDAHILFWHTGGQFGMAEKEEQLLELLPPGQCRRLVVQP